MVSTGGLFSVIADVTIEHSRLFRNVFDLSQVAHYNSDGN